MTRMTYEIRVAGRLGPAGQEAFCDVSVLPEPTATVLVGEFDQAALHGLIDRVWALGLELVDVRRALPRPQQVS